ncbi:L-histidine carboxy-lyase (histamine-forming) [Roseimicrobium gellanilyticum]|uniref:L-histidine carboxy-lyase (Histamine-forming) n=2 Tax=Roseimicrobium gellanilyticum TaxID=748857 RepID=A0A366HUE1_9BACT|nr:L-histidine carboxy-lyase (histamine-forming) [Roseimicrobium gellanilyticum]
MHAMKSGTSALGPPVLPPAERERLDELYTRLSSLKPGNIGYPCNQNFDYSELFRFLEFSANNVGDPFNATNYRLNTQDFEREVLADFARYTRAPENEWWGYVNNGGTEGNMYGLYVARELYPDGICYFSEDTHYSVAKILRLQHTRNIMLKSQPNGELDYDDLHETLRIHRDVPPIIFANIGTTMKGAVDDLAKIRAVLDDLAIPNYYIHADAALSGMILPFVDAPQAWDFADGADSIAISGHKFLGSPLPCGVALARKKNVDRIARSIEYVGALDTTIAGSRNAFTPLMLWYRLRVLGDAGLRKLVQDCLDTAEYAVQKLNAAGIASWRNANSVTVVFPRPPTAIMQKWIIAPKKDIGHLITMPHVTKECIDAFVSDFTAALAGKPLT